ncbi:MAG: multicopper oxidase domain-containing protein [Desulfuromonadales bacterium]|nr:multicopper oxidase domain-containing protein [Desulfuromonadales bacterium]
MKRRQFIQSGLAVLAVAGVGSTGLFLLNKESLLSTVFASNFTTPLPIPPLLENLDKSGKIAQFKLTAQRGKKIFFPGKTTQTFGYNGDFLGPTIRVRNGQRFKIQVNNTLPETTTLHWHGLHVPSRWDGGPRQPIAPGTSWNPDFTIKQQAATLWYHPHAMGKTGEQVYHGMAGLFLIDDEVSDQLDIPKAYGVDDIPVVLQDRRFFSDGQFAYVQNRHEIMNGVIGNYLLVNGVMSPTLRVENRRLRLRLLNGSNSSIYRICFAGSHPFQMIASDGGFLNRPVPMTSIILSAGERAEVVLDLATVKNRNLSLLVDQQGGQRFIAMDIDVAETLKSSAELPTILNRAERIPESEADTSRRFVMQTMGMGMMGGKRLSINGKKMNINRIDEKVKLGSTEIWEITNQSGMMMRMPHSMHLHDVQQQILDRDGQEPPAHERGRKDTVLIQPGETVRIISRFRDYKGVYMYHCHLLEHEDDGMMGQFEVV